MGGSSINHSVITSSDDILIPPPEFTTTEQLEILQNPEKCDLLGIIHHKEFYRTQSRSDLDNAIFCARKVAEICPLENPLRRKYLFRLGNWLVSRCDRFEEREGLNEALEVLGECLEEGDEEDNYAGELDESRRADAFTCVARCRRLLYLENGSEDDFDASVEANENAISIYEDLGANRKLATAERAVAIIHEDRYDKEKDSIEYLDLAIIWAKYAVWSCEGVGIWGECVTNLSRLYKRRYVVSVEEEDDGVLQDAIEVWEDLFVTNDSERQKAAYQFEVGRAYFHLTKITESSSDGSEASSNIRGALQSTPNDDPARPERMKLSNECFDLLSDTVGFDFRGKSTNAEIKAKKYEISLSESGEHSAAKAKLLEELAFMRFDRYQSEQTTSEAISAKNALEEAVQSTPENDYQKQVHRLRTIAFFCHNIYKEMDKPRYLDEGLPWARKAANVCENSEGIDKSLKALTLHTLALMLSDKVEEDSGDNRTMIMEVVEYGKKAVELISEECNGNDNCEHCGDRAMFVEDLERFQRVYDRASAVPSGTGDDHSFSRTVEGEG